MFRIMITDLWLTIVKKLPSKILYAICGAGIPMLAGDIRLGSLELPALADWMTIRSAVTLLCMFFLYLLANELPLRICRGVFLCAAGRKEKLTYLAEQFCVKLLFSLLFTSGMLFFLTGGIFASEQSGMKMTQGIICFFTICNSNLRVGIGIRGARKLDAKGFAIYSKAEIAVNTNWFCALLFQNVLFYSLVIFQAPLSDSMSFLFAGGCLAVNGYYTLRYLKPTFEEALSYEDVYRQEPEKEYVQHDI